MIIQVKFEQVIDWAHANYLMSTWSSFSPTPLDICMHVCMWIYTHTYIHMHMCMHMYVYIFYGYLINMEKERVYGWLLQCWWSIIFPCLIFRQSRHCRFLINTYPTWLWLCKMLIHHLFSLSTYDLCSKFIYFSALEYSSSYLINLIKMLSSLNSASMLWLMIPWIRRRWRKTMKKFASIVY